MKKQILVIFVLLINLLCISGLFALTPTSEWKDFYGNAIGGKAGDLIVAKDPQGIVCGEFKIINNGYYGFMAVYADDASTSVDEGAKAGENISFYFNNNLIGKSVFDAGKEIINYNLTIRKCTENWKCSVWSKCVNGIKTRTCRDANNCGTVKYKPAESQKCRFIWF